MKKNLSILVRHTNLIFDWLQIVVFLERIRIAKTPSIPSTTVARYMGHHKIPDANFLGQKNHIGTIGTKYQTFKRKSKSGIRYISAHFELTAAAPSHRNIITNVTPYKDALCMLCVFFFLSSSPLLAIRPLFLLHIYISAFLWSKYETGLM